MSSEQNLLVFLINPSDIYHPTTMILKHISNDKTVKHVTDHIIKHNPFWTAGEILITSDLINFKQPKLNSTLISNLGPRDVVYFEGRGLVKVGPTLRRTTVRSVPISSSVPTNVTTENIDYEIDEFEEFEEFGELDEFGQPRKEISIRQTTSGTNVVPSFASPSLTTGRQMAIPITVNRQNKFEEELISARPILTTENSQSYRVDRYAPIPTYPTLEESRPTAGNVTFSIDNRSIPMSTQSQISTFGSNRSLTGNRNTVSSSRLGTAMTPRY